MLLLVLAVGLSGAVAGAYVRVDIPAPHPEAVVQSTVFLDAHGDYLGRRGPVDRQDVSLSRVPRHVQDAVIAAENRSFRTDSGIAPTAIARAVWAAVTGGARQGGSTITQQYIKNALLSPEQSLSRKAKEALIAVKLDRTRSKNEILQGYLNTVYFGRGAAGIQAAARNYFGIDAAQLSLAQGAALAAIINLPSYYERAGADPKVTTTLQSRWAWVLDGMAQSGAITSSQRARAVFPAFRFYPPGQTEGQRQYLLDAAAAEATDRLHISPDELARGGYTVHTTFDLTLQDRATQSVHAQTDTIDHTHRKPGKTRLHTAIVAIVPGDGAIRLLYGGGDYSRQPFNDALDGAIETGTALDPLRTAQLKTPLDQLRHDATATPVQVTVAYAALAALAAHGRYAAPYTITKITRGGKIVYKAHPTTHPAITGATTEVAAGGLVTLDDRAVRQTGGAADRTAWSTTYGPRLALSVSLFAEHPAASNHPAAPASLTSLIGRHPQGAAIQAAADIWSSQAPSQR
ncbi:transglycosylase domain-containing protein [Streptomyces sp. NPDC060085]|uniref:transglycosylase domain-containing protein n=1 Tax=Streptomyces sp. NPDC060085 TaxID=3347054 RepID=UPI003664F8C3